MIKTAKRFLSWLFNVNSVEPKKMIHDYPEDNRPDDDPKMSVKSGWSGRDNYYRRLRITNLFEN